MAILLDLLALLAVPAIAYILYRRFFSPAPGKDRLVELAYEEGFRDAVRRFGLKKLYEEDQELKQRMTQVLDEAGVRNDFEDISERGKKSEHVHQTGVRTKRG